MAAADLDPRGQGCPERYSLTPSSLLGLDGGQARHLDLPLGPRVEAASDGESALASRRTDRLFRLSDLNRGRKAWEGAPTVGQERKQLCLW